MRLLDDDTNTQLFDICILLTREEVVELVSYLEFVLSQEYDERPDEPIESQFLVTNALGPGSHGRIFRSSDRQMREIIPIRYEDASATNDAWHPRTLRLINDSVGRLDYLGPETHPSSEANVLGGELAMRMIDLHSKQQITGLSLLITSADAVRFLEELRDFAVIPPEPDSQRALVDSGQDESQAEYISRRLVPMKYDSRRGGENGWPDAFRDLILDDSVSLQRVEIDY